MGGYGWVGVGGIASVAGGCTGFAGGVYAG
jgi:hypothetical protein